MLTDEEVRAYAQSKDETVSALAREVQKLRKFPKAKWSVLDARKRTGCMFLDLALQIAGKQFHQQLTVDEYTIHSLQSGFGNFLQAEVHRLNHDMRASFWREIAPEYWMAEAVNDFLEKASR